MLQTITREKKVQFYSFPLFFIYCILAFYIFPRGSFSYALFLLPIIMTSVIYEIITERIKFKISDIIISFALIFCSVAYNYSSVKLANALGLILLLFVCRYPQSIDRKKLYPLYLIALTGIMYQLMNYQHISGVRVLSNGAPNFSAYMILLFFLFSFKNRYLIGVVFSIVCAFNFFSRAYFLSLLAFGIICLNETKIVRAISKKLKNLLPKRVPIILIILVFNSIVLFYSVYYINQYSLDDSSGNLARTDLNRVTNLDDSSNYARWLGNKQTFDVLVEEPSTLLFGIRENRKMLIDKAAHNSLLNLLLNRGLIFSTVYLIGLGIIIRRVHQLDNLKYILSAIATSFFLHALFDGVYLIFLVATLTLKSQKGKWML